MGNAYVVGQISIKDPAKWEEYRSQVPETLGPWQGGLVFRGKRSQVMAGACPHADIVVIRFPDLAAATGWHESAAYQALIPLRQQAADVVLVSYEA